MDNVIVVVNGKPRSGKDSFCKFVADYCEQNNTYCDDQLILDFDEHFAGRFTEVPQLLYKVILENDRDFFHSLPTLIEKLTKTMEEKLPANSLPNQGKVTEAMDSIAQKVKENLG